MQLRFSNSQSINKTILQTIWIAIANDSEAVKENTGVIQVFQIMEL